MQNTNSRLGLVPESLRKQFGKMELLFFFGPNTSKTTWLRSHVFTDDVLDRLGITPDEWRAARILKPIHCERIRQYLLDTYPNLCL